MAKPLVSICIPNYNNARYLDTCLESALAQTYGNVEIILTDDCSTDQSVEVARKYGPRVRIYENDRNLGQTRNTNRCIELSSGKYLIILHSDDALLPNAVDDLVPILEAYPEAGMAAGERLEMDETGATRSLAPFYDRDCLIPGEKQAKVFMMAAFVPCQVLVRRSTIDAAGRAHEQHIVNLDGLLWFKCALHGDMGYLQKPVCRYRKHAESTTSHYNRSIRHMLEYHGTLTEMFRLAQDRPYLKQFFQDAEKRVGLLTVRYCHDVIKSRNFELARRYLSLATVFDPEIVHTHDYRTLKYCVESTATDPLELYYRLVPANAHVRTTSYAPPEGSSPLNRLRSSPTLHFKTDQAELHPLPLQEA